jgi:titin
VRVNKETIPLADDLQLRVAELVESNVYEFRVAAENKAGIGEFSPPSKPITAKDPWDKPGKPGKVYNKVLFI